MIYTFTHKLVTDIRPIMQLLPPHAVTTISLEA